MDSIRKQASKLREQVAKQEQAVRRRFATGNGSPFADEIELQRHDQLERLYTSTRATKHLQKDVVRGVEGFISLSLKQTEIAMKLAEDCCKYSNERHSTDSNILARASLHFGSSHSTIEKERENLLRTLGVQVSDPLRAMVMSAPLEDARHLTQRYDRIWQDVESQATEVLKRQMKVRDSETNTDSKVKLHSAQSRLEELKSTLSALGKEAVAAMMSVEDQQQRVTFERLMTMVEAEQSYHQTVADILSNLRCQMLAEKQHCNAAVESEKPESPPISAPPLDTGGPAESTEMKSANSPPHAYVSPLSVNIAKPPLADGTGFSPVDNNPPTDRPVDIAKPPSADGTGFSPVDNNPPTDRPVDIVEPPSAAGNISSPQVDGDRFPSANDAKANGTVNHESTTLKAVYYIAEAIQSFDAQDEDELSLSLGDYVVVRQVSPAGWSEGECRGKAGWFPSVYVQKRDKAPASKIGEVTASL